MVERTTAEDLNVVSFDLEPLDVLFFRDGRPFDVAPRAVGGTPMPQTIAGAFRTWLLTRLGADLGRLGVSIRNGASFGEATAEQGPGPRAVGRLGLRGPWFVKEGERLVPTPATIEIDTEGKLYRLDPLADDLPGWTPPMEGMLPLWRRSRGSTRARGGYLCRSGLERFLSGGVPYADEIVDAEALFGNEDRIGIGVDVRTQAAGEGMIYAVRLMRLCPGVTLAADLVGAPEDLTACPYDDDVLPLGGEARRVIVRRSSAAYCWPKAHTGNENGRLVLLMTPAPFGGWRPPDLSPVAAAVPGYLPVSGWDLARGGPKPNRFAVRAGSVYFFEQTAGLSGRKGSLCTGENAALGWGAYVEGVWSYG